MVERNQSRGQKRNIIQIWLVRINITRAVKVAEKRNSS